MISSKNLVVVINVMMYSLVVIARGDQELQSPSRRYHWSSNVPDFFHERWLSDGERERTAHWQKFTAYQLSVVSPNGDRAGLSLHQLSDGNMFLQLITDINGQLMDCDSERDSQAIAAFFRRFTQDFSCAEHRTLEDDSFNRSPPDVNCLFSQATDAVNETFDLITESSNPITLSVVRDMVNYRDARQQCLELHRRTKAIFSGNQLSMAEKLMTDAVSDEDSVEDNSLLNPEGKSRKRRDLFLYPGTNWCGSGNSAQKFAHLGSSSTADRCCREHDHCPYTIDAFKTKYDLFNYRFHTISHCECDERFRACLKMSKNGASTMVGKIFFNVVRTKCFVFKKKEHCAKRGWWGKCLKWGKQKVAVLRDGLSF